MKRAGGHRRPLLWPWLVAESALRRSADTAATTVSVGGLMAASEPAKTVVELGNFSIVNPKPPGAPVLDGDFSVDNGNAAQGAKLFKAKCAACHTIKEGGAPCGPIRVRRVGVGSGRAARELRTR